MINYKSIRQMSVLVGVIAIAVVLVIIPNNTEEEESQSSSENTIGSESVHGESVAAPSPTTIMPSGLSAEKKQELLKRTAENITRLQALLDDDDRHEEALDLALKMSKGNRTERAASLDTFLWVGGPRSVKALISLRHDTPEISDRANDVLQHLLQQELHESSNGEETSSSLFDMDDWFQLLDSNENVDEANAYLMLLTSFDIETAAPVLIKLLETDNPDNQARAREYLEFISNGLSLNTPEQAREWLEKYKRGETTSFKEKEDTAASSDEIGTDAGTGTATATEGQ